MSNDKDPTINNLFAQARNMHPSDLEVSNAIGEFSVRRQRRNRRLRNSLLAAPICGALLFAGFIGFDVVSGSKTPSSAFLVEQAQAAVKKQGKLLSLRLTIALPAETTKPLMETLTSAQKDLAKTENGGARAGATNMLRKAIDHDGNLKFATIDGHLDIEKNRGHVSYSSPILGKKIMAEMAYEGNHGRVYLPRTNVISKDFDPFANKDNSPQSKMVEDFIVDPQAIYERALKHKDRLKLSGERTINGQRVYVVTVSPTADERKAKVDLYELLINRDTFMPAGIKMSSEGQAVLLLFERFQQLPQTAANERLLKFQPPAGARVEESKDGDTLLREEMEQMSGGHLTTRIYDDGHH